MLQNTIQTDSAAFSYFIKLQTIVRSGKLEDVNSFFELIDDLSNVYPDIQNQYLKNWYDGLFNVLINAKVSINLTTSTSEIYESTLPVLYIIYFYKKFIDYDNEELVIKLAPPFGFNILCHPFDAFMSNYDQLSQYGSQLSFPEYPSSWRLTLDTIIKSWRNNSTMIPDKIIYQSSMIFPNTGPKFADFSLFEQRILDGWSDFNNLTDRIKTFQANMLHSLLKEKKPSPDLYIYMLYHIIAMCAGTDEQREYAYKVIQEPSNSFRNSDTFLNQIIYFCLWYNANQFNNSAQLCTQQFIEKLDEIKMAAASYDDEQGSIGEILSKTILDSIEKYHNSIYFCNDYPMYDDPYDCNNTSTGLNILLSDTIFALNETCQQLANNQTK